MAEIGVLELQIRDNAEHAGEGLNQLAGALSAVKKAVGKGLGLSTVANQVVGMSKTINEALGTNTTVKNLASLFNSIASFSKIKKINIDTDSLEKFKTSISGFSIGNAGTQMRSLQQALSGTWSTDGFAQATGIIVSAGNIFDSNGTASKLSTVTNALTKFTKAYKDLPNSTKKMENVLGNFVVSDLKSNYEAAFERAKEAKAAGSKGLMAYNPQQFGGKGSGRRKKQVSEQLQMDLGDAANSAFTNVEEKVTKVTSAVKEFNVQLTESKDIITSIAVNNLDGMYKQFSELSYELGWFKKETLRLGEGDTTYWNAMREGTERVRESLRGMNDYLENSGRLSDRLAMSLGNMSPGTAIIPYTGERSTDILGESRAYAEYQEFHKAVSPGNMLSTWVDNGEQWKPDWSFFDDGIAKAAELKEFLDKVKDTISFIHTPTGSSASDMYASMLDNMKQTNEAAEAFYHTMERTNEIVQDTSWRAGDMAKQFENMFNAWSDMRSMFTLGSGQEGIAGFIGNGIPGLESGVQETGWTYWKDGAIEVEGTVTDAMDNIGGHLENTKLYLTGIVGTTEELGSDTQEVTENIRQASEEELAYARHIEEVCAAKREEAALAQQISAAQKSRFESYGEKEHIGIDETNRMADNLTQLDLLKAKLVEAEQKYNEFVNTFGAGASKTIQQGLTVSDLRDKIWSLSQSYEQMTEAEEEAEQSTHRLRSAFNSLKSGIQKMFPTLTSMIKRLGGIAKYRALRAVLKHISDGFKEGWENLKGYKDAIGDEFATQIKEANAQLLTMKNSIGAAVAPAFQALLPILNSIVSAVITVINWVNQLISLLTGKSTWTKATEASADSLDNVKKSAGGASKAVKDLLADWDELNIIQSESGGGGGGGGGKAEADYASMFEEMTEFDQKIKDIISFIDEHMGGIWEVVQLIGAAILGWKISKAFDNVLGYIGRLIAGGALLTLGFKLSYGAGYEAGKKGGYELQEIIESALGTIAAGVGGALIFGTTGAIIAISVTALLNFLGFKRGEQDRIDEDKWGDLHLTQEEVEAFVREQFTFDVDATVNLLKGHIENEHSAREDLNTQIENFSKSLDEAKANVALNVDSEITSQSVVNASADALDAIANVQALINASNAGLTFTLKEFTFKDSEGKDISGEILSSIKIADTVLSDYFTGIGQKIADLILEGEKSGWANGEAEQALALMESQKRIYDRAAELRKDMETDSKIKQTVKNATKNGVFDRETANASMEEQKKLLKEVEETTRQQKEELASNYYYLASLAQASAEEAGLDTEQGGALKFAADTYREKADTIVNGMEQAVKDKLAETKKTMAAEWAEALKVVYGEDLFKNIDYSTDEQGSFFEWFDKLFGEGHSTAATIERFAKYGDYDKAADYIKQAIADALTGTDPNGIMKFTLEDLGMDPIAFLNEEMRSLVAKNVIKNSGNNDIAFEILKSLFHFDKEEASKYFGTEFTSNKLWETAQDEIEEGVKKGGKFTVGATGMEFDFTEFKEEVKHGVEGLTWEDDPVPVNIMIDPVIPDFGGDQLTAEDLGITEPVVIPVVFEDAEESILEQLNRQENTTGRRKIPGVTQASGDFAFAGATSGVQYAPYNSEGQGIQSTDISGDVQTGVENGSTQQVSLLGQLLSVMNAVAEYTRQTAEKEFSVTISPSADWGLHNQRSGEAAESVTG